MLLVESVRKTGWNSDDELMLQLKTATTIAHTYKRRDMIQDLCLDGLAAEHRERLDHELTPCILAAMEDLAQSTNIQDG